MITVVEKSIAQLTAYGLKTGLIEKEDEIYVRNLILDALDMDEYREPGDIPEDEELEAILAGILDYAIEKGIISDSVTEKDLFDTKIMGFLTPRPSEVNRKFYELYDSSKESATEYFYKLCCDSDYIRRYRIKRDMKWKYASEYGDIDITINLSKPEKDPKAIAAAKNAVQSGYPKCMLCKENTGYRGRMNHPARQNLRAIPVTICGEEWGFQYSPYVYYNEHCIVFNGSHTPMKIDKAAFDKLFDFVKAFPHYFVGSNADLPIVGGSILSHEHFQGGHYTFAMEKARIEKSLTFNGYEDIEAGIVKWPLSVIRLRSEDTARLTELGDKILKKWRAYSDESAFIFAETDGEPHNTITPIARRSEGKYELDLVLRNNICTEEHPLGVFHPHAELHHIKKENIGLIEVMGLAVLPSRLKNEMALVEKYLVEDRDVASCPEIASHAEWCKELKKEYSDINTENVEEIVRKEIGKVFTTVLEHAGVYKRDEAGRAAFMRFAAECGAE